MVSSVTLLNTVRNQLDLRHEELRIRRQTLLEAHAALEKAISEEQDREAEIFEERYVFSSPTMVASLVDLGLNLVILQCTFIRTTFRASTTPQFPPLHTFVHLPH